MSRLTNNNKDNPILKDVGHANCKNICEHEMFCDMCPIQDAIEKLCHYEDLEEQGRLIELPRRVGDTVWYVEEISSYTPIYHTYYRCYSFDIEYIEITEKWIAFGIEGSGMLADHRFYVRDIGKTIFLTKEEAEAKLAELKGE